MPSAPQPVAALRRQQQLQQRPQQFELQQLFELDERIGVREQQQQRVELLLLEQQLQRAQRLRRGGRRRLAPLDRSALARRAEPARTVVVRNGCVPARSIRRVSGKEERGA